MRYNTPMLHATEHAQILVAGTGGSDKAANTCFDGNTDPNQRTTGAYEVDE
jgi:hypothetical protein